MAALQKVRKATSVLKSPQADPPRPCLSASTSPSADSFPLATSTTDYPCLVHKCGAISVSLISLSLLSFIWASSPYGGQVLKDRQLASLRGSVFADIPLSKAGHMVQLRVSVGNDCTRAWMPGRCFLGGPLVEESSMCNYYLHCLTVTELSFKTPFDHFFFSKKPSMSSPKLFLT